MQRIPYTNTGKTGVYIGGTYIKPGETRPVDPTLVPAPPAEEEAIVPVDLVAYLDKTSVAKVVETLKERSATEIDQLLEAERGRGDKARSTLIQALELERLDRLDQATEADRDRARAKEHLADLDEATLLANLTNLDHSETPREDLERILASYRLGAEVERENQNREAVIVAFEKAAQEAEAILAEGAKE